MYHYFFTVAGYFAMHNSDMESFKTELGERIRKLREAKKFGVREFALLADIEHHQLINIEKGRVDMRISTLRKIAGSLSMTLSELVDF